MSTSTILPGPELHPRSLRYGSPTADATQKAPAPLAATRPGTAVAASSPQREGFGLSTLPGDETTRLSSAPSRSEFLHDTCPECGWDGDAALVVDPDAGVVGWECPDCRTFVTTRDLEDA